MSFKKTEVVMLPTNEKAPNHDYLFLYKPSNRLVKDGFVQNLYFLSDEEIKEGDWFLSNLNEILKCTKREDKFVCYEKLTVPGVSKVAQPFSIHINLKPKKIIATTDESLNISKYAPQLWKYLPQPSTSFIEKFVEEYNKGNVITEVLVEYNEPITEIPKPYKPYSEVEHLDGTLKVSKDNTITIRKVKDSWNRDEVVELAKRYAKRCQAPMTDSKWFEENL